MQKTLLITGGSRGIGAATALLAARQGYSVAVNYATHSAAADEVVRKIRAAGGRAFSVQADVAVEKDILAMFKKIDIEFGRLDALVNNAGVVDQTSRVDAMTLARLQRMFAVNVFGSFLCAREAVKRMSTGDRDRRLRRARPVEADRITPRLELHDVEGGGSRLIGVDTADEEAPVRGV